MALCISNKSFHLICLKPQLKHFRSLEAVRGHQKVKHWIYCCYCIPWVSIFQMICIKPQLKHFYFGGHFRSLEVVRGHQMVNHWIRCGYCIPWVPSFRLICLKLQYKYFHFRRSFQAIRRSNTGFVAATVFPGFLAFI